MSGDPKNNGWILQETNVSYIHCHHPGKSKQLYVADKVKFTLGRRQNNITTYISWEFVLKQMPLRSRDIRPLLFLSHPTCSWHRCRDPLLTPPNSVVCPQDF
jgi:hypothetical protein